MKQLFLRVHRTGTTLSFVPFIFYFLIYIFSFVNSEPPTELPVSSSSFSENATTSRNLVFTSLQRLSGIYQNSFNFLAKEIDQISVKSNRPTTSRCYSELSRILRRGFTTEWTAKLLQANSFMSNGHFIPSSLISEKFSSLGDFDACLSLRSFPSQYFNSSIYYKGKYCLVHLTTHHIDSKAPETATNAISPENYIQQLAGKWVRMGNRLGNVNGICVPSICTATEITYLIQTDFAQYLPGITIQVKNCQIISSKQTSISKSDVFYNLARTILTIFFFLSLTCTFLSPFCVESNSILTEFVQSFNLKTNFTFLWQTQNDTNSHESTIVLHFSDGLRVLLNMITISAHCFIAFPTSFFSALSSFTPYSAYITQLQSYYPFFDSFPILAGFVMDHFFLMSGFLMAYTTCRNASSPPRLLNYIAHRWCRLAPSLIGLFGIIFVLPKLGSGPLFHSQLTDVYLKPCRSNWWTHLLFLNNWTNLEEMCESHLWFIASDFQLRLLLYPILVIFFWKPIWAFTAIALLIVSSLSGLFAIVWLGLGSTPHFPFRFNFDLPIPDMLSIKLLYTSPQMHLFPYFTGVLLAFYLIKSKKTPVVNSFSQDFFICILSLLILVTILHPIPPFVKSEPLDETLYHLFMHFLHTFFAGTFFYRLLIVRGSALGHLFTCPFFLPLSRLSYGMYLVHPALIWFNLSQIRVAQPLNTWYQIQFFLTIYLQSFLVSIFLYVFVEKPFCNLHKKFSKRWKTDDKE